MSLKRNDPARHDAHNGMVSPAARPQSNFSRNQPSRRGGMGGAMHLIRIFNHKKVLAAVAGALALPSLAWAISNGVLSTAAVLVLGQPDFIHTSANAPNGASLSETGQVAIDLSGGPGATRIYIADVANHRVLGWDSVSALTSGAAANIVLGQPNFFASLCNQGGPVSANTLCNPSGVATDSAGNVYVADESNNRVLEFAKPAASAIDPNANLVLGQAGDMFSNRCNFGGSPNAETLCAPATVTVDAGNNLYVGDFSNSRVLRFNTPLTVNGGVPGSGDTVADEVFGQADFVSGSCDQGGVTATSLCRPLAVAVDSAGDVYIADQSNNRVLEFNTPPLNSVDPAANLVFGQPYLTTGGCNDNSGTNGALNLCEPTGVAVDASNNLYIADFSNNRALEFNTPLTTDVIADNVFGQGGDLGSTICNVDGTSPTAQTLCSPGYLTVNPGTGQLWIGDQGNNRAVAFNSPLTNTVANLELGQIDFNHGAANNVAKTSMNFPEGIAVDTSVTPNRVYVVDTRNNRVLGYANETALANNSPASILIGQPDFESANADYNGVTPNSLNNPIGAAVDSHGNLYVADTNNNRVLEYNKPFSSGFTVAQPANMSWGQDGDLYSSNCNFGASPDADTLCSPDAVALDSAGNLYVADTNNHRALEYNNPLNNVMANFVFGQSGSFTSNTCNLGGAGPTAATLCLPNGIAVDGQGNVYIDDQDNHRVLEYNNPFAPGGSANATMVFGQANSFTSGSCDLNGVNANSLCFPDLLAVDSAGDLFVADGGNSRVLEYTTPPVSGTTASHVFGQGDDFTSFFCNLGASLASSQTLCTPVAVAVDSTGNLFVADYGNSRALKYDPPALGPNRASFDGVPAGKTATKTFYFMSDSLSVNISSISFSGPSAGNFRQTNSCPATLKPKSKCAITVTYKSTGGNPNATLSVFDNAYNSPSSATLR